MSADDCAMVGPVWLWPANKDFMMRLVKLDSEDGPVYVNPEHVVYVRKALKNTRVDTISGHISVIGDPAQIARMLGAEELQIEISSPKMLDQRRA
jgi:hypothetical protein